MRRSNLPTADRGLHSTWHASVPESNTVPILFARLACASRGSTSARRSQAGRQNAPGIGARRRPLMPTEPIEAPHVARTALEADILTPGAMEFLGRLSERFGPTRRDLLARRRQRQDRLDAGELPDFLPQTRDLHQADWTVAPIPPDLR